MTDEQTQMELQRVIDAVVTRCQGWPVSEIKAALAKGLTDIGHPAQSESWLRAVAEEAADGHPYIVGTRTAHPSHPSSPMGVRAQDRQRGQEVASGRDPERSAPGSDEHGEP
ncbi:MAG TPA: hypothetical protein VFL99_02235 [Segeticoccus sp.]|uniref:hypothetical protein n=1 Tax=Segeticoccus sp. TaxID=2706531 RepID=UPI002D7F0E36|nr:hypothetical protein [Segeticoccus sp.]HET8599116.1 hypothetical protein [Segeticoccus sp.]